MPLHTMSHDGPLMALSFAVALFASYTALDMGSRLRVAAGRARWFWLVGSAVVLGGGIWSMHFVAMLAFKPGIALDYDPHLTGLSLIIAITFVAIGFQIVTRPKPSVLRQLSAGAVVGCGVAAMHYTGMAALILSGRVIYDGRLVALSVLIAMIAATAALWLTLNLRTWWQRIAAAVVMAVAVCGMHYTAMMATSFLCTPGQSAHVAAISQTLLAAAVSVAQFVILCLALVCVFVDRRFEFLAEREAEILRAANRELSATQFALRNLLDNADQGFLTIGPDLLVEAQCSAACETILGISPQGEGIVRLLCRDAPRAVRTTLQVTLESVFRDSVEFVRDLKIGLLPGVFELSGKTVRATYKYLPDDRRLMVILTDVTDTKQLGEAVERESKRLQMIVLALTENEPFSALVQDYERFLHDELPLLIKLVRTPGILGDLRRRLHTFKGLLSQFSFAGSPQRIHELETSLLVQTDEPVDSGAVRTLQAALRDDLDSVAKVLGADFTSAGRRVVLPYRQVQDMKKTAFGLLEKGGSVSGDLRNLLCTIARLGNLDAKSSISLHTQGAVALALRLEKQLLPIRVDGDDVSLPAEEYAEFFRALVHVFRNAVDHGIETPEERLQSGKPAEGTIRCAVTDGRETFAILIADDGRGVDRTALEAKLIAAGAPPAKAAGLSLEDLIFCEGLSSRETASEVSGRGIGLAAVKQELDRLGGSVFVESRPGSGTRFHFTLPIADHALIAPSRTETLCR